MLCNSTNIISGVVGFSISTSKFSDNGSKTCGLLVNSLKNFSKDSHTVEFLKDEIIRVIDEIGAKKFCSVISDHASNVALAKNLVSEKYSHILPMRCIAHHINLLTSDIMKIDWAAKIIANCRKVVTYFTQSHVAGELLKNEIAKNMVIGGGLKKYVKTRWTTAFDCTDSIVRCESVLKQVSNHNIYI